MGLRRMVGTLERLRKSRRAHGGISEGQITRKPPTHFGGVPYTRSRRYRTVCRRVEAEYREGLDEAEQMKKIAGILAEAVYAYLKKRGLLTLHRPHKAEKDNTEAHEPGGEDSP